MIRQALCAILLVSVVLIDETKGSAASSMTLIRKPKPAAPKPVVKTTKKPVAEPIIETKCDIGFEADGTECKDIDECHVTPSICDSVPHTRCVNIVGGHRCNCVDGFTNIADADNCNMTAVCKRNFGKSESAAATGEGYCERSADCSYWASSLKGMIDTSKKAGKRCNCRAGYEEIAGGYHCTISCSFDERHATKCTEKVNEECSRVNGNPGCICRPGYKRDANHQCTINVNECEICAHDCHINGYCVDRENVQPDGKLFDCECNKGFSSHSDGRVCKNIDECDAATTESNNCDVASGRADCIDTEGSFKCQCKEGWRGNTAKNAGTLESPCINTNECEIEPSICGEGTICADTQGSFECKCKPGYDRVDEKTCAERDECLVGFLNKTDECHKLADCTNEIGGVPGASCKCKFGFMGDGIKDCKPDPSVQCKVCDKRSTNCELKTDKSGYECNCKKFFEKWFAAEVACKPIEECASPETNDCHALADCIDIDLGFECKCGKLYKGDGKKVCEPIDPCMTKDCSSQVGTTCVAVKDKAECQCVPPTVMVNHRCVDDRSCIVADESLCQREGNTYDAKTKKCSCVEGTQFQQLTCSCNDIDECSNPTAPPCDVNAYCVNRIPFVHDGALFECKCERGFEGTGGPGNCTNIDECKVTKGICSPVLNSKCVDTIPTEQDPRGYTCQCKEGFEDTNVIKTANSRANCRDINECTRSPCAANSFCLNTIGNFTCHCLDNFEPFAAPKDNVKIHGCKDTDECKIQTFLDKCEQQHATCHNKEGGHRCVCKDGYERHDGCETCEDIDECQLGRDKCNFMQTCENTPGSYKCNCNIGYKPAGNETHPTCENIDECANPKAIHCEQPEHRCEDRQPMYSCICNKGYKGRQISASPFVERCEIPHVCEENPDICGNRGQCVPDRTKLPGYKCACHTPQYANLDERTCVDVYHCDDKYKCPGLSSCVNNQCVCKENYQWSFFIPEQHLKLTMLDNRTACEPIDPCLNNYGNCKIAQHETCVPNGPGQRNCSCTTGYTKDILEISCINKNECALNTTLCKGEKDATQFCVDLPGDYECQCAEGYANTNPTGCAHTIDCQNINECLDPVENNCDPDTTICVDRTPGKQCKCKPGYEHCQKACTMKNPEDEELVCHDINECQREMHDCGEGAICQNMIGGYTCRCPDGTKDASPNLPLEKGRVCQPINECELGRHNCDAETQVCEDTPYSFQCNCNDQHELDPTTKKCKPKNGCTDLGGTKKCAEDNKECYDDVKGEGLAGYRCACKLGFEENYNGTCINENECTNGYYSDMCPGFMEECVDRNPTPLFNCNCKQGYEKNVSSCKKRDGEEFDGWPQTCDCTDIDECKKFPCSKNNATCTNTAGSFKCACKVGYAGDPASELGCKSIDPCDGHTCGKNAECKMIRKEPVCICDPNHVREKGKEDGDHCYPNLCETKSRCIPGNSMKCEPGRLHGRTQVFRGQCVCESKKFQLIHGKQCNDVNECCGQDGPNTCENKKLCAGEYQLCKNNVGGSECICDEYHKHDTNAKGLKPGEVKCITINECKELPNACPSNANCTDLENGWTCDCPEGMRFNGIKSTPRKCMPNTGCLAKGSKTQTLCIEKNTICKDFSAKNGTFLCDCIDGHVGDPKVGCIVPEPCKSWPTTGVCKSRPHSHCVQNPQDKTKFDCLCDFGFVLNGTSSKCDDVNECEVGFDNDDACENNQLCKNREAGYDCKLIKGYVLSDTNVEVVGEKSSPQGKMGPESNPTGMVKNTFEIGDNLDECKNGTDTCDDVKEICIDLVPTNEAPARFQCKCKTPEYKMGPDGVCIDADQCLTTQCVPHSTCRDLIGGYECNCDEHYTKTKNGSCEPIKYCELKLDNCDPTAKCIDLDVYYECKCPKGTLQKSDNKCYNKTQTCGESCPENSWCMMSTDQTVHNCTCKVGYRRNGAVCDEINECTDKITPHNCHATNATCENTPGSFTCECKEPLVGDGVDCTVPDNLCKTSQNDCPKLLSQCKQLQYPVNGSYIDCVCNDGYVKNGFHSCGNCNECDDKLFKQCQPNVALRFPTACPKEAKCIDEPEGKWDCKCPKGFEFNWNTHLCDDIDECEAPVCGGHGQCKNTPGSYECVCDTGARNKKETVKSSPCELINECTDAKVKHQCNTTSTVCVDRQVLYECQCKKNYVQDTEYSCARDTVCERRYYDRPPVCGDGMICEMTDDGHKCNCKVGHKLGPAVKAPQLQRCIPHNNCTTTTCGENAFCFVQPTDKKEICVCFDGYEGDPKKRCNAVKKCSKTDGPPICPPHTVCEDIHDGQHLCKCTDRRFKFDGSRCVPIKPCTEDRLAYPDICPKGTVCHNMGPIEIRDTPGAAPYKCICENNANRSFNETTKSTAECPKLSCADMPCDRMPHTRCEHPRGGIPYCKCQPGFQYINGICTPIANCLRPVCSHYADCTELDVGEYSCKCKPGFKGDGKTCTDIRECDNPSSVCDTNADCFERIGSFNCKCHKGFEGTGTVGNCRDIDECLLNPPECQAMHMNETTDCKGCKNLPDGKGYECVPSDGYEHPPKSNKFCTDTNECASQNATTPAFNADGNALCHPLNCGAECKRLHSCVNTRGSYTCDCAKGYELVGQDAKICTNINECLDKSVCDVNANCEDTPGSFKCTCNEGYKQVGKKCQLIDLCKSNTTNTCDLETTKCEIKNDKPFFLCECKPGYMRVDENSCENINECLPEAAGKKLCPAANQICRDTIGSYACDCVKSRRSWMQPWFKMDNVTKKCVDIDECQQDPAYKADLKAYDAWVKAGKIGTYKSVPATIKGSAYDTCVRKSKGQMTQQFFVYDYSVGNFQNFTKTSVEMEGRRVHDVRCINHDGGFTCGCQPHQTSTVSYTSNRYQRVICSIEESCASIKGSGNACEKQKPGSICVDDKANNLYNCECPEDYTLQPAANGFPAACVKYTCDSVKDCPIFTDADGKVWENAVTCTLDSDYNSLPPHNVKKCKPGEGFELVYNFTENSLTVQDLDECDCQYNCGRPPVGEDEHAFCSAHIKCVNRIGAAQPQCECLKPNHQQRRVGTEKICECVEAYDCPLNQWQLQPTPATSNSSSACQCIDMATLNPEWLKTGPICSFIKKPLAYEYAFNTFKNTAEFFQAMCEVAEGSGGYKKLHCGIPGLPTSKNPAELKAEDSAYFNYHGECIAPHEDDGPDHPVTKFESRECAKGEKPEFQEHGSFQWVCKKTRKTTAAVDNQDSIYDCGGNYAMPRLESPMHDLLTKPVIVEEYEDDDDDNKPEPNIVPKKA